MPYFRSNVPTGDALSATPRPCWSSTTSTDFRLPTVSSLDARLEKAFKIQRANMMLDLDIFNIVNAATVLGRQYDLRLTGPTGYNQMLEIMNPRILRLGARLQLLGRPVTRVRAARYRALHWTPGFACRQPRGFSFWRASANAHGGNLLCLVLARSVDRVRPFRCFWPRAAAEAAATVGGTGGRRHDTPADDAHESLLDGPAGRHDRSRSIGAASPAARPAVRQEDADRRQSARPRCRGDGAAPLGRGAARSNEQIRAAVEATSRGEPQPAITTPAPVAEDVGEIAVIQDTGDLDPAAEPLRRAQHRPPVHAQRLELHAVEDRRHVPLRRSARALTLARRRQRAGERFRSRSRSTAPGRPPRSSIRTATSPSARRTRSSTERNVGAPGHRPAARRAVLRRPRSVDGHRQDLRQRRGRSVHRHLVQRPRLRLDAHRDGAGDAAARRQRRDEVRRHHQHRRRRSSASRPDTRPTSRSWTCTTGSGVGRRRDRRALRAGELDRHVRGREEVLRDAPRQLRPDPAVDRSAAHPRRVRLRAERRERGPRHRPGHLRHVALDRQRAAGCGRWS